MNYPPIIRALREMGYTGYLSVECFYAGAKREDPRGVVPHDLGVLRGLMREP